MIKGLGAITTAVLISVIGAFMLPLIQPVAGRIGSSDRLVGKVLIGPWREIPGAVRSKDVRHLSSGWIKAVESNSRAATARIEVTNPGTKTVHNVGLRIEGGFGQKMTYEVLGPGGAEQNVGADDFIRVPDLKPGDRSIIFVWSSTDLDFLMETRLIRSYSDQGPIALHVQDFSDVDLDFPVALSNFRTFEVAYGIVSALVIVGMGVAFAIVWMLYAKTLLDSPKFYAEERARLKAVGFSSFQFNIKRASKIQKLLTQGSPEASLEEKLLDEEHKRA